MGCILRGEALRMRVSKPGQAYSGSLLKKTAEGKQNRKTPEKKSC